MRFIDEVTVSVSGGNGGDGSVHFRREKFAPRGGPDGGNGGNGGAVIFVADTSLSTLLEFAYSSQLRAENGTAGDENRMDGRDGKDLYCKIPVGSQVFFQDQLVADLSVAGARWIAAKGGKGGKGNAFFTSSTNQSPDYSQPGQPGEEFRFKIILKSVADIGLVGFPNVGKSTLIASISQARPKIADYEFTTLTPNLGVVSVGDSRYVVADIPGIIPEAHLGKGLGIQFLKHIERTRAIAFVIDLFREDGGSSDLERARYQYEILEKELRNFSEELGKLSRAVVLTKADLGIESSQISDVLEYFRDLDLPVYIVSGVTAEGTSELKQGLLNLGKR